MSLPHFKYHPDPIATGMFKPKLADCPCCGRATEYVYATRPYATRPNRVENLCPDCIHNGAAATKFKAQFSDGEPLARVGLKREIIEEVVYRTPGFISWQGDVWLTCCDDACEFHGDLKKDELLDLPLTVMERFRAEHSVIDKNWEVISSNYIPGGSPAIYKFVCRHCHTIRLGFDFN